MKQKQKLELLQEALVEMVDAIEHQLSNVKNLLYELAFGPGPARPVTIDLGPEINRRLSRMISRKKPPKKRA
jgi:hypothetical protein